MAVVELRMTAHAVGETCHGCGRAFRRGEQMNGMRYDDGEVAGWHCDECVKQWKERGEAELPRWEETA